MSVARQLPLEQGKSRGGQNICTPTGVMALGCAAWSSPPAPFGRLRRRPEAQPEGAGLSGFAGEPALSLSKRGDQSRARGRSNAVQATLTRMFCPPLKSRGTGGGWKEGWNAPNPSNGQGRGSTGSPQAGKPCSLSFHNQYHQISARRWRLQKGTSVCPAFS